MRAADLKKIVFLIAVGLASQTSHAVLERTGPIDTANGFPRWYMDTTGLNFELCLPLTPAELASGHCLLLPGDAPATPEVFPGLFSDEHFWWEAGASMTTASGGKATLTLGLEAAFSADVAPGNQITFSRIRARLTPVPVSGTYRFIHPYGEESLVGTAGDRIFFTDDVGIGAPGDFTGAIKGRIGPFLLPSLSPGAAEIPPVSGPVSGKLYIADPARIGPVTGSPLPDFMGNDGRMHNHNIFRIEGPRGSNLGGVGVDFIETTGFSLMGRIYTGQVPSLVVPERATYTRNGGDQKVDVFATAYRSAGSRLPGSARPVGVAPVTSFFNAPCGTVLDAAGDLVAYTSPASNALESQMGALKNSRWGQSRIASGIALPDSVCLKDNSAVNINGQTVPSYHPMPINDVVLVTDVFFDSANSTLTVKATSSDQVIPPVLTVADFNAPLNSGVVNISGVTTPPAKIRVTSTIGGMGESSDVRTSDAGTALITQAPVTTTSPPVTTTSPPVTTTPSPVTTTPPPVTTTPSPINPTNTAESIAVTGADYVVSKSRWKVNGTTTVATAHTLKLMLLCPSQLLPGTTTAITLGTTTSIGIAFAFDILNASAVNTTSCTAVRVDSSLGNVSPSVTFRLK